MAWRHVGDSRRRGRGRLAYDRRHGGRCVPRSASCLTSSRSTSSSATSGTRGSRRPAAHAPWVAERLSTFRRGDEQRFWLLDFHYPRGMVPLGYIFPEDGICWGTQLAAEALPLPPSRGLAVRMAGPHIYSGQVDVTSRLAAASHAASASPATCPASSSSFPAIVGRPRRRAGDAGSPTSRTTITCSTRPPPIGTLLRRRPGLLPPGVGDPLRDDVPAAGGVRRLLRPVPAAAASTRRDLQVPAGLRLQDHGGRPPAVGADHGGPPGRAHRAVRLDRRPRICSTRSRRAQHEHANGWLHSFDEFLATHGNRTEGIADVVLPSWREDSTSPLGTIKTFLQKPDDHDFGDRPRADGGRARRGHRARPQHAVAAPSGASSTPAWPTCEAANFAWWNEEHNYYIDLRAHLPMRRAALALGRRRRGAATPPTDCSCSVPSSRPSRAASGPGRRSPGDLRAARLLRRAGSPGGPTCPRCSARSPTTSTTRCCAGSSAWATTSSRRSAAATGGQVLSGVAASGGVVRGRARVLHGADELHRIEPGEILVCEATSPNWTPAFAKIAACVCDSGGTLTHAAIVAREYRVPAVVGTAVATNVIATGDLLEVDGDDRDRPRRGSSRRVAVRAAVHVGAADGAHRGGRRDHCAHRRRGEGVTPGRRRLPLRPPRPRRATSPGRRRSCSGTRPPARWSRSAGRSTMSPSAITWSPVSSSAAGRAAGVVVASSPCAAGRRRRREPPDRRAGCCVAARRSTSSPTSAPSPRRWWCTAAPSCPSRPPCPGRRPPCSAARWPPGWAPSRTSPASAAATRSSSSGAAASASTSCRPPRAAGAAVRHRRRPRRRAPPPCRRGVRRHRGARRQRRRRVGDLVSAATGGGADHVFDAVGRVDDDALALDLTASGGSAYAVGIYPEGTTVPVAVDPPARRQATRRDPDGRRRPTTSTSPGSSTAISPATSSSTSSSPTASASTRSTPPSTPCARPTGTRTIVTFPLPAEAR